jgi:phasin family protein
MNLLTPEQIAAAQESNLDFVFGLTNNIVAGVATLAELNLRALQSTLAETKKSAQRVLSVKGPQEGGALQASLAAPIAEKMQSYSRQVWEIVSATQAEFARIAQTQYKAYTDRTQTLFEDVAKRAPAGSETGIAAWKSVIELTNTLYETAQKNSQQAVQVANSNFDAAAVAASKAARHASAASGNSAKQ